MKLYRKINNYLLYQYPNIWVTRVHLFLPIGMLILIAIFCVDVFLFPFNPKEDMPDGATGAFLMVIPVLIYLVYWFVFQARYNVEKSGGKLTIIQEYLNYFIYFTIYTLGLLLIFVFPIANDYKIYKTVDSSVFKKDIETLNLGNSIVSNIGSLTKKEDKYTFYTSPFVYDYYYNGKNDYDDPITEEITVSKKELLTIIKNFNSTVSKYTNREIAISPEEIIALNLANVDTDYYFDYNYFSNSNSYDYRNDPRNKVDKINSYQQRGFLKVYFQKEALQVISMMLALLALLTWVFKQVNWKEFTFGLIALALTPLVIAIIGVVFFGIIQLDDDFGFVLVLLAYIIAAIIVLKGVFALEKNLSVIITTIYLHFFLPFIPFFILGLYTELFRMSNFNNFLDYLVIIGWIIGLISIGLFKLIYKHYRFLPSVK